MTAEHLQNFCLSLKATTQDIKWGKDLCFCVGEKMYHVQGMEEPISVSFKTTPEEFSNLIERLGVSPAPYVARYHWVAVKDLDALSRQEWEHFLKMSYDLVTSKFSKAKRQELGID